MDKLDSPEPRAPHESAWDRTRNYVKEERPPQPARKIAVQGDVDLVLQRSGKPMLVVAGETAEAVASVKTYCKGDVLVIERDAIKIGVGADSQVFYGRVGSVVVGDMVNGMRANMTISRSKVAVCVGLAQAPAIQVMGSGDITLADLDQTELDLDILGSGDITASGQIGHLEVRIAGSGAVDAEDLIVDSAGLSITGSGDIRAFVRADVRARVTGSGSIVVRGNPPHRDYGVTGSGKIKFR